MHSPNILARVVNNMTDNRAEFIQTEPRRKEEISFSSWPSNEEYKNFKDKVVDKNKPIFKNLIKNNTELFVGLDDQQIDNLAEGLAVFAFGVRMVYRRFGQKYDEVPILISNDGLKGGATIGVLVEEGVYAMDPVKLTKLAKENKKSEYVSGEHGGIDSPLFLDLFEMVGVEEGAHYLFIKEKGHDGKPGVQDNGLGYEYHTSDIEHRALLWKLSYARRYKPAYEDDLDFLYWQTSLIRGEVSGGKKQNE